MYLYILTVKHRCVIYSNIEFELQGGIFYYRVQKKPNDDQDLVINFRMLSRNSKKLPRHIGEECSVLNSSKLYIAEICKQAQYRPE